MIRGLDNNGCVILGLTRQEIDGLLEGKRCCFEARLPEAPGPHICIYFGETNEDVLARLRVPYGEMPAAKDYRTAQCSLCSLRFPVAELGERFICAACKEILSAGEDNDRV